LVWYCEILKPSKEEFMMKRPLFKKHNNVHLLLILLLFLMLGPEITIAGSGYKYVRNYSKTNYDHHPQNWCIIQDADGIIFVGNRGGVLEYDGVLWRLIWIPKLLARVLTIDTLGTIYVGGYNELGFLSADYMGNLQYKSLFNRLENKYRNFGSIIQAFSARDGVYFRSSKYLFRWDYKKFQTWTSSNSFLAAYSINGKIYIQQKKSGLQVLENDIFHDIPGVSSFAEKEEAGKINMMVPFGKHPGNLLVGTKAAGFYLYDGIRVTRFPTEADALLTEQRNLLHGIRLLSGEFALATDGIGVIIIDSAGKIRHRFDKTSGLLDHNVKYLYQEPGGNLWLALNNGLSKIEYESPFSIFDQRTRLSGTVLSLVKHGDTGPYYVGTTEGLYRLLPSGFFQLVPGVFRTCWSLVSQGDSIIAASEDGTYAINNNGPVLIDSHKAFCLAASQENSNQVWAGGKKTLISYVKHNRSNHWETRSIKLDIQVQSIVEEPDGTLWLGSQSKGIVSVSFPGSPDQVIRKYSGEHGLPEEEDHTLGEINVARIADHTVFATQHGLYRFDKDRGRFVRDPILGKDPTGEKDFDDGTHPIFRIVEGPNGNIWFHSRSVTYEAVRQPDGTYRIENRALSRLPISQVNLLYPESNAVWLCAYDSLIRYDSGYRFKEPDPFSIFLRRIERIDDKKLLFGGHRQKTSNEPVSQLAVFSFDYRSLRFFFASPFYQEESATLYSYYLKEYDRDWSGWSSETRKDYTNLDPGDYIFFVKSKNVYGQMSSRADRFSFKILPPWYRTTLAYIVYILALLVVFPLIVRFRYRHLEREKRQLETIVEQRTHEIQEKNLQLEDKTRLLTLQSEQLKEMDKVKSRFFANISHEFRTPLTLIMGPLEQILSGLSDIPLKNKIQLMLRNSRRLLGLINQLLDLSRFSGGKMRLQVTRKNIIPFIRGIMASFKLLSEQRQIEFRFLPQQDDITLYFNSENLEQIMYNLLSNAFKNTPPGGSITVYAAASLVPDKSGTFPEGFLKVSVADTGVGIPANRLTHIFELFYQHQSSYEYKAKGSGIGLALTRELVELHHGDIQVRSLEGKGAEFVFCIPLGRFHLKQDEIIDVTLQPLIRPGTEPYNTIIPDSETPAPVETVAEPCPSPVGNREGEVKTLILVVEDNVDMRRYLCSAFEPGYQVLEAVDGKDGWEKASASVPDLVISDVLMPNMDGFELCRRIKEDPGTCHIPVILLTARSSPDSILEGLRTGADDYIPKPFNLEILGARVKNLIELRRQGQERMKNRMALQPEEIYVSPLDEQFFKELQEVIGKHLADPGLSVEGLAGLLHMGRTTLYRKILALTGESPTQFIRSYRLHRAMQLLKARAGNVSEVSSRVGFTNPVYFSHCFKKKYRISPSEVDTRLDQNDNEVSPNNEVNPGQEPLNKSFAGVQGRVFQNEPLVAEGQNSTQAEVQDQELILIIEDNPDLCDYTRDILEFHYRVEIVTDGHQGLERAQRLIPDLIISDILMPGVDGFELSQRLKSDIATSHIPIILLTARAAEKDILKGFTLGVDDYITKPFNTDILLARIRNILRLRSHRQANRKRIISLEPADIHVSSMDEQFLKEVDQCIEENLSDFDFSVEVLAEKLYIGRTTLYRKILALTGENPTQYIRSFRLNRAAQMLKEQNRSIIEVAFDVGFSSSSYFTRCFKEMFHRLPSGFGDSETN
jgi:DNA-binding response OmpR family regulator/signal transduction histidine kinase